MALLSQLNIFNNTAIGCPEPTPHARDAQYVENLLTLQVTMTTEGRDQGGRSQESLVVHGVQRLSGVADASTILYSFVSGERGRSCYLFILLKKTNKSVLRSLDS